MTSPFDGAKYRALLEGLEISILKLSDVLSENQSFRLDSGYFDKCALAVVEKIKEKTWKHLESLTSQIESFGAYALMNDVSYCEEGIPFLRCVNIKNGYAHFDDVLYIDETAHKILAKSEVRPGMVLLTMSGTVGNATVALPEWKYPINSNQDISKIVPNDDINPFYLLAFLEGSIGRKIVGRLPVGSVQQHIFLWQLQQLPIPVMSCDVQKAISDIVVQSFQQEVKSDNYLHHAEQTLLRTLGLEDWQPPEALTYERKSSDVFAIGRLDAEHFQPKYDNLYRQIKNTGIETRSLREIILPVMNGFDCRDFVDEGTPYIRVGDVKKGRIDLDSAFRIPLTADEIGKDISLQVGDVLFTRKGSFGNAAPVWNESKQAIISSEIMLLRLCSEYKTNVLPEYLALFLNSIAGSIQAEKWAHGAAFYSITQEDLGSFVIPLISKSEQESLCNLILQSETARKQAHNLLECAKQAVEIGIEENETVAMEFLRQSQEVTK